tara:strand:+ start:74 stop:262 length:189 start_codon:yes stop_codon:yes gene_type:complete
MAYELINGSKGKKQGIKTKEFQFKNIRKNYKVKKIYFGINVKALDKNLISKIFYQNYFNFLL